MTSSTFFGSKNFVLTFLRARFTYPLSLTAKKADRNLPAMLRIALQAGKLPHRLVLWQILFADSLKSLNDKLH
jgi:hypothetical protein